MSGPSDAVLGWHFVGHGSTGFAPARTTRYGPVATIEAGSELVVTGPVVLGACGLHAGTTILGALAHAPGPWLCRVEVSGGVVRKDGVLAGRRRRVLAFADVSAGLHAAAREVAGRVIVDPEVRCRHDAAQAALAATTAAGPEPARRRAARYALFAAQDRLAALDVLGRRPEVMAAWAASWECPWAAAREAARHAAGRLGPVAIENRLLAAAVAAGLSL